MHLKPEPIVAYIIIAAGIFLVIFAAYLAYGDYKTFSPALSQQSQDVGGVLSSVISSLLVLAMKLGYLGILVWGGSLLIKHGIQLLLGLRK